MIRLLFLIFLLISSLYGGSSTILKMEIDGVIGPATSSYVKEGMKFANIQNADIVMLQLNTPGGLSTSMREIVEEIINSSIPVVSFVYPKGSRAASAGTYILYASHIAAMASGTNLGAATPVSLTPMSKTNDLNLTAPSALEKKVINDAVAYIKSLAQLNDRNITWAIDAVKEGKSLSAVDALQHDVIDLMADSTEELLDKIDGRVVIIQSSEVVLNSKESEIINYEIDFKTRILSIITNPNIAYIFLLIAIYGVFFELMNPGAIIPGVIGVISGVIALYALNMIPFNYAGLLLIVLGISFMIAEVLIAGFGVLGIGGVLAFVFGSFLLFDAQTLGDSVSIPLIIAFSIVSLAFFILVMKFFISSRKSKIVSGVEEMLGSVAKVIKVDGKKYFVRCHGEIWSAVSESELQVGQKVEVTALNELTLSVKPIEE